ncbi:MAG: class I SAM-dependent methyltransferase [Patescibacteria group bacterium]
MPDINPTVAKILNQGKPVSSGRSELLDAGQILREIVKLKVGDMVGDLGAGGGLFLLEAARLVGDQGQVYAVDVVKNILSEIESKARLNGLNNIKTIWSNLEIVGATKINEGTLDANILVNVLFQSQKHYEILAEATRLLKPGGKLLIVDWANNDLGVGPPNNRIVDQNQVKNLAQQLDLVLAQEFKAGKYHFGLLFAKK